MPTDPLENLLRQTDAAHPPGIASHHDLASGARVAWKRTRHRQQIAMATSVLVIGAIALGLAVRNHPTKSVFVSNGLPTGSTLVSAVDRNDLVAEQAMEERVIRSMLALERRDAAQRQLDRSSKLDALQRFADEREQSALVILQGATATSQPAQIAAIYREVAEAFPGTGAALVARQQLTQVH